MQVRQEILSIEKIYNFEMFHKLRNYQITNWQILLSGMQKITILVKTTIENLQDKSSP